MNSNFYDDFPPDATGYVDHEYAAFGGDGNYYEGNMEDFGTDDDFYGYVGNNEEYDASYDAYQSHIPPLMPNAYNNPRAPPPVLPHHLQAVQRYKQQKAENEYLKLEHRREMEYQKAQAKKERDKKRAETRKKDLLELIKVKNPVAALYEWCQSQGDVRPTFDEKSTVTGSIPKPPPRGRGRGGPNVIPEGISRSWVIREWSCVTTVGIHKGVGTGSDKRKAKEASVLNLIENMVKYVTDPPPEEEESKYTPRPPKRSKKYHAVSRTITINIFTVYCLNIVHTVCKLEGMCCSTWVCLYLQNINTKGVAGLQKEAGWMPAWDSSAPPDGSGKGVVRVDVQVLFIVVLAPDYLTPFFLESI